MTQNKYCSPLIYSIIFVLFRGSTSHDLEYAPFLLPILIFKYMHCNKPLSCSAHRIICYMGERGWWTVDRQVPGFSGGAPWRGGASVATAAYARSVSGW